MKFIKNKLFLSTLFSYMLFGQGLITSTPAQASDVKEVGCISTTFNALSPNDKICVKSFHDPDLNGITCYVSRAITGGWKGAVGIAEDPSRFSISCNQTGSVDTSRLSDSPVEVFKDSASFFAKTVNVKRLFDKPNNTIIYLVYSTKIVDGSPMNSISVVPIH